MKSNYLKVYEVSSNSNTSVAQENDSHSRLLVKEFNISI